MWCFVAKGEIELSASVDRGVLHLYVMATDREFVLQDVDQLSPGGDQPAGRPG